MFCNIICRETMHQREPCRYVIHGFLFCICFSTVVWVNTLVLRGWLDNSSFSTTTFAAFSQPYEQKCLSVLNCFRKKAHLRAERSASASGLCGRFLFDWFLISLGCFTNASNVDCCAFVRDDSCFRFCKFSVVSVDATTSFPLVAPVDLRVFAFCVISTLGALFSLSLSFMMETDSVLLRILSGSRSGTRGLSIGVSNIEWRCRWVSGLGLGDEFGRSHVVLVTFPSAA